MTKSVKIIKCAKICHSMCSKALDLLELSFSMFINLLEIAIFGRSVVIEGQRFDLFLKDSDPLKDIDNFFKK